MKNLKPSKLPEGTVIDDDRYGEYIKRADGIWEETSCDYMGDRERVTDVGYDMTGSDEYRKAWHARYSLCDRRKSDDYFTTYKVIAVPPEYSFESILKYNLIHGPWVETMGSYADGSRPHKCKGYNCTA